MGISDSLEHTRACLQSRHAYNGKVFAVAGGETNPFFQERVVPHTAIWVEQWRDRTKRLHPTRTEPTGDVEDRFDAGQVAEEESARQGRTRPGTFRG